jgi:hypothetical protein
MPRASKGARLWWRKDRNAWFILDKGRHLGTGCGAEDRSGAENALLKYVEGRQDAPRSKFVYFITTEHPGFPVKIGISESHRMRITSLQTGLPYKVRVIAIVPTDDAIFERRLHRKFDHIRLSGEWFEQTPELLTYISELISDRIAA